jgi:GH15 family glucan-1,4-alpha-glucosidase
VPGNPWIICTCWLAEYHIAAAQTIEELHRGRQLLEWVVKHASPSGMLAEQMHPLTGEPLSIAPLTWSHAAYCTAVDRYVAKYHLLTAPPQN